MSQTGKVIRQSTEEALHKFINDVGGDLNALLPQVTRSRTKRPQPEALRRAQAKKKAT